MYDPDNKFEFLTEDEKLWDRVSHKRFLKILQRFEIDHITFDYNSYGYFMFVGLKISKTVYIEFWGLGYHEDRDRYYVDEWNFNYDSYCRDSYWYKENIPAETAIKQIETRKKEIELLAIKHKQSEHGSLFEELAEIADDDGVSNFFVDMGL